ncbi:hypothetical protein [Acinetobacter haemolyticus]|uniref:Uncharacterized protein n=1 Tax=Acinetobacter haemolyticus TaxID=29430 RepID=A0A4P7B2A8_ACIHA|nr:hypothetical protein [Acinetobacter haemolyticus]QBQ14988.1 hypothetical protein AHTJR_01215 [Acinetobacter haemolyticus]
MELRYEFSEDDFLALCLKNLERKKTTIFEDLYETLRYFLSTPDSVVITDVRHRFYPEYYDDHLSLKEYIDKGQMILPYVEFDLSSDKNIDLEVTDINIPPFVKLNNFQYGEGITQSYKIKNTKLKTKNKSSIRLLSVEMPLTLLEKLYSRMTPPVELLPSKLGVWEWRQTFYNKMTGESFFCSCFKDALAKDDMGLSIRHAHLTNALENYSFKESICHICTKTNSDLMYCHKMYGSAFKARYGAYITKQAIQEGIDERDAENHIRELKGVAKIGERWVNETLLFNYINLLFPQFTVQREASPSWLNKQRFDVYIPELNLAIEYQGQQHYVAVDLFGGEEGLKRTKQRDKEKLQLSKINGVDIVYFSYKENLTEKLVQNRLKNYLKEDV